jgi:hypothetical protein
MSVHVLTCTIYNFNALMTVVALIRLVFLHLITKMSDWFLEQQINIKFCMKLGKIASDICAVLSEAYGGETLKNSSVFEWHKWFKEKMKMMNEVAQDISELT